MTRQYIGARYVPKIFTDESGSSDWKDSVPYEELTIVTYLGNSYTSKKPVPVGVQIDNSEYWVLTGNYNAQVEQYREEVEILDSAVNTLSNRFNFFDNYVTPQMYGAKNDGLIFTGDNKLWNVEGVQDFTYNRDFDNSTAFNRAMSESENGVVFIPNGYYVIKSPLEIPSGCVLIGESKDYTILFLDFEGDNGIVMQGCDNGGLVNLKIVNIGNVTNGIVVNNGVSPHTGESILNNVSVLKFNKGFVFKRYAWLGNYNYLYASFCDYGFDIYTSDTAFFNIYAYKCPTIGINVQNSNNEIIGGKCFLCGTHSTAYQSVQISGYRNKLIGYEIQDCLGNGLTLQGEGHIISGCTIDSCGQMYSESESPINAFAIKGTANNVNIQCEINNYINERYTQYGGIDITSGFKNSVLNIVFTDGINLPYKMDSNNPLVDTKIISNILPCELYNSTLKRLNCNTFSGSSSITKIPLINYTDNVVEISNNEIKVKYDGLYKFSMSFDYQNTASSGKETSALRIKNKTHNAEFYKQWTTQQSLTDSIVMEFEMWAKKNDVIELSISATDSYSYSVSNVLLYYNVGR